MFFLKSSQFVTSNQLGWNNNCYDKVRFNICYDKASRNSCNDEAGLNSCYNKDGRNSYYHDAGRIGIVLRILPPQVDMIIAPNALTSYDLVFLHVEDDSYSLKIEWILYIEVMRNLHFTQF